MKDNFIPSLGFVFRHECEYEPGHYGDLNFVRTENVPGDDGGLTKWGIDAADHPGVDIAALTQEQATAIYHDGEWTTCMCEALPDGVDTAVFDEAVNTGCKESALLLQHAINLNGYKLDLDGSIGLKTVAAALAICSLSRWNLLKPLIGLRRLHYQLIAARNPHDRQFLAGWLNRVDDLERFISGLAPVDNAAGVKA